MIYTPRLLDAVHFSISVHQLGATPQHRKGKPNVPYITHPLTVGLILSQANTNEDVVIAGILHDVIEDCDPHGTVTRDMIAARFTEPVAELVDSVTEKDRSLGWHERKEEAMQEIKQFSHDSLLVKSADVISNNTELIEDYAFAGDTTFERFYATKEEMLSHTLEVIKVIVDAWNENPLRDDLEIIARKLSDMLNVEKINEYSAA